MAGLIEYITKEERFFGLTVGVLYVIAGVLQVVEAFYTLAWAENILFIHGDVPAGMVLIMVGAVFLYGFKELGTGIGEGVAYVYVGIILAMMFAGVYILLAGADMLMAYVVQSEDFAEWRLLDDLNPTIYLAILTFPGYLHWKGRLGGT